MSTFNLKLIAIITMLIDHIGAVFLTYNTDIYWVFRGVGRLAFPIFVFLIVEGFYHTRDVKKYLIRLGAFALISEIPFDLAFKGRLFDWSHQNVFFTLFLGLFLITLMSIVKKKNRNDVMMIGIYDALLIFAFCVIAFWLSTDYTFIGILLIVAFYLFRGNNIYLALSLLFIMFFSLGGISTIATVSMIFIFLYNGEKGKSAKYLFYIFYPAHLIILFLLKTYL